MKVSKKHAPQLIIAASAVGALFLAMVAPSVAFADASVSAIDPDGIGSITITKMAVTDPGAFLPGDGAQHDDVAGTPLEGVTYQVCLIPSFSVFHQTSVPPDPIDGWTETHVMDMTTSDAWSSIPLLEQNLTPSPAYSGWTDCTSVTTDKDGLAVFDDLPIGAYQVMETSVPDGVAANATPFLVTIPMVDPSDTDNWMYDVYVYPKNITNAATKSIVDQDAVVLGDSITYTVTLPLADTSENSYDTVYFFDKLDSRVALNPLQYDENNIDPASYSVSTNYPLDPACQVLFVASAITSDWTDFPEFSDNALMLIPLGTFHDCAVAHDDAVLTFTIHATVIGPIGDGIIPNTAFVFPNQASFNVNVPIVTNTVTTKWGNIDINKTGKDGAPLEGVTFQLYYANGNGPLTGPVKDSSGSPITLTTDATGAAQVAVRYSCYVNDATVTGDACRTYYLVETSTLKGYILLDKPIKVDSVDSLDTSVDVVNVLSTPLLPLTGGTMAAGTWALYGGGCLILVGGVLLLTRLRRQEVAKAA